ncbi:MAG TPA: GNAT family N-acetyltransferase [Chthonomonadales bacterium]|nr:GNAT family N-acetyltransferase [Chthonomonadales bacterium]
MPWRVRWRDPRRLEPERAPFANGEFRVRPAHHGDVDALTALWGEMMAAHRAVDERFVFAPDVERSVRQHLRSLVRSSDSCVLVLEAGSALVGYVVGDLHRRPPWYPAGSFGFVSDMYVCPEWRRKGFGTALVRALEEWMAARGVTAIELLAAERNPGGLAFWRALGYTDYLRMMRREMGPGAASDDLAQGATMGGDEPREDLLDSGDTR